MTITERYFNSDTFGAQPANTTYQWRAGLVAKIVYTFAFNTLTTAISESPGNRSGLSFDAMDNIATFDILILQKHSQEDGLAGIFARGTGIDETDINTPAFVTTGGNSFVFLTYTNGTRVDHTSSSGSVNFKDWHWLRLNFDAEDIFRFKSWQFGSDEPETWSGNYDATATIVDFPAGKIGWFCSESIDHELLYFAISDNPAESVPIPELTKIEEYRKVKSEKIRFHDHNNMSVPAIFSKINNRYNSYRTVQNNAIYGNYILEGITVIEQVPVQRIVYLFREENQRPGNLEKNDLTFIAETESDPNGYWKFENLNPNFVFTIKTMDREGIYNPLIRGGLKPIPE